MDVFKAVTERRSIRKFQDRDIPYDMVERLIKAILWAPSAGNLQSRKFYFITEQGIKDALAKAALSQRFIQKAPLVIIGCTDSNIYSGYGDRGVTLYSVQDVSCSIMGMMLVAHEMGLGTVWVGAFHEGEVTETLKLPGHLRPVAIVPVGWPDKAPSPTYRVPAEEAIVWIK